LDRIWTRLGQDLDGPLTGFELDLDKTEGTGIGQDLDKTE
jgi:hypothetical protein